MVQWLIFNRMFDELKQVECFKEIKSYNVKYKEKK